MENPEGVLNLLDEFAKLKSKEIPSDLEEYLLYVAASGDPVYQWSLIKSLYRQKLINVITEFYEMCPVMDIPPCPNVDPFNYETMKNSLLKRLDSFSSAPFTIQRISELLTTPRKQYNRVDKFMRAIEKNIWVVSTREPGSREPATNSQETSAATNLVNGVSPRVCVTVKHPKRVKSIEERIKSGHPQLIDDDDEEEEEEEEEEEVDDYEQMEVESNTEILPSAEQDDNSSLQCTSVKDLIEKYENGTIFSNPEEKTEFEEKTVQMAEEGSGGGSEEPETTTATATTSEAVPSTSDVTSDQNSKREEESAEAETGGGMAVTTTAEAAAAAAGESAPEPEVATEREPEKEEVMPPVVAADSSSDLPEKDVEMEEDEEEESKEAEAEAESTVPSEGVEESRPEVPESSTVEDAVMSESPAEPSTTGTSTPTEETEAEGGGTEEAEPKEKEEMQPTEGSPTTTEEERELKTVEPEVKEERKETEA